jgi:hypothetical protein
VRIEYGLLAAQLFSIKAQKLSRDRLVTKEGVRYAMQLGMLRRSYMLL